MLSTCFLTFFSSFYRARDFRPAWIDDGLTLTGATSFLAALGLVSEDGPDPKNYHRDAIKSLLSEIKAALGKRPRASAIPGGYLLAGRSRSGRRGKQGIGSAPLWSDF